MKRVQPTISHLDSMELDVNDFRRNPYAVPKAKELERESDMHQDSGLHSEPGLFGFTGRLSMLRYWTQLILFCVYIPLTVSIFHMYNLHEPILTFSSTEYYLAIGIVILLVTLFGLSIMVRRFHDFNASGWWSLLFFIPFFSYFVMLIIGLIPASTGDNDYGAKNIGQSVISKIFSWLVILSLFAVVPYGYKVYSDSIWVFLPVQ